MRAPGNEEHEPTPLDAADGSTPGAVVWLLGIVAAALVLRLYRLDQWSLWIDELNNVNSTVELAGGFVDWRFFAWLPSLIGFELAGVDMASLDPSEIWTWRAAGITEWTMRAPVALLGGATILVLGLVGQRTLGRHPTQWLCLLLALSPWHLWMSQTGRFYMQLFLLYNLALLLYYQATANDRLGAAVAAMVCVVLAFYTTPIALMILGVFGIDVAVRWLRRRPSGMRPAFWAMAVTTVGLCALSTLQRLSLRPEEYAEFAGTPQSIPAMTVGMVYLIGLPLVVVAALGFWVLIRRNERLAILLVAAAVVPLAAFVGFNLLGKDTHVRYTFVALFAWLALAAIGIEQIVAALRPRVGALVAALPAVALLSTFALSDYIYMTGGAGYRAQWRQAMAYIEAHRRPGELIIGDNSGYRMAQYYLADPDAVVHPEGFSPERDLHDLASGPTWILQQYGGRDADRLHGARQEGGDAAADRPPERVAVGVLRAYFLNRIAQPFRAVNVYYYTPIAVPAAADRPALPAGRD